MKKTMEKLEALLEPGGTKKDIVFLILSGLALLVSIFRLLPLPLDAAWVAIILCGIPIILEAVIGLVTALDIKADVLVSLALIASVCIGEDFAAGEVAFIMQLGALLEDLTVAKARAGIEKLVLATPTAIMAAIGNATKHGFLVREGDALERLAKVTTVTFDKTGTLTYGVPEVVRSRSVSPTLSDDALYRLCAASTIAGQLRIAEVHAACLPEDKLTYIRTCQQSGGSVCMMGDGVNDAPALKAADVGIAMGAAGSTLTIPLKDLVLTYQNTSSTALRITAAAPPPPEKSNALPLPHFFA